MDSIIHLIVSLAIYSCTIVSAICAGICIKCLTEIYKEQTIKRRYENQEPTFKYKKEEKRYTK